MAGLARHLPQTLVAARIANPDLRIERIMFPTAKSGAFVLHGQDEAILVRSRANAVWTQADTGAVVLTTDGRDLNLHHRIAAHPDCVSAGLEPAQTPESRDRLSAGGQGP